MHCQWISIRICSCPSVCRHDGCASRGRGVRLVRRDLRTVYSPSEADHGVVTVLPLRKK